MPDNKTFKLDRGLTDWLKIFACLAVVVSHYVGHRVSAGSELTPIMQILGHGGYWGVAIFFLLSGYGIMESEKQNHLSFKSFLKKRLLKIYIPAVLSGVIYLDIRLITNILPPPCTTLQFANLLFGCLWGWYDGILWFIKVLIVLYLLFYMFTVVSTHLSNKLSLAFLVVLAGTTFFYYWLTKPGYVYVSVPTFFLGVFISKFEKEANRLFGSSLLSTLVLAVFVALVFFLRHNGLVVHAMTDYIFILIMLIILARFKVEIPQPNKKITDMTYDVYLTHYKVLILLGSSICPIPVLYFIGTTVIATICFYLLRKQIVKLII